MKRYHKKKVQQCITVFLLITIAAFFITTFIRDNTNTVLSQHIQVCLDAYDEGQYTVTEPLTITNTLSTMGNFYSVVTNQNITMQTCIVRIMGIAGPVPAVFLHNNGSTNFIGVSGLTTMIYENQHGLTANQLSYWENTITQVFSEYTSQGDTEQ